MSEKKHELNCLKSQAYGTGCSCGAEPVASPQATRPLCPKCNNPLTAIEYPSGHMLNRDQWESQLAGDLFCTCHNNSRGNKPYAYFWKHEFRAAQPAAGTTPQAERPKFDDLCDRCITATHCIVNGCCLAEARAVAPVETPDREVVWLVESRIGGKFDGWWVGPAKEEGGWRTENAWAAKRFTKAEAELVAATLDYFPTPFRYSHWIATEHVFIKGEYSRPVDYLEKLPTFSKPSANVETRLTAEQFYPTYANELFRGKPLLMPQHEVVMAIRDVFELMEAFRDKSEAARSPFAAHNWQHWNEMCKTAQEQARAVLEQNAGLREEIERLDKENEVFRQLNEQLNQGIRELRAKLAEQERK